METLIAGLILWSGISVVTSMFVLMCALTEGDFYSKAYDLYHNPKKEMNVGWLILGILVLPLLIIGVILSAIVCLLEIIYRVVLEPVLSIKLFKGE